MTAAHAVQYLLSSLRDDSGIRHTRDQQNECDRARDNGWAERIRLGDERSFELLFTAYVEPLVRFAASYVADEGASRELVTDVFLNIWRQRSTWNPEHGVAVYLYGAVRNRAMNAQRSARRSARWAAVIELDDDLPGHGTRHESPERRLDREETAVIVWRAIDALPEPRRQAVILRWHHGMSAPDIAAVLGVTPGAVYQILNRAHALLRELLGPALG
jgi:RNA polymerase sigma-70 factor, ECF subfamily